MTTSVIDGLKAIEIQKEHGVRIGFVEWLRNHPCQPPLELVTIHQARQSIMAGTMQDNFCLLSLFGDVSDQQYDTVGAIGGTTDLARGEFDGEFCVRAQAQQAFAASVIAVDGQALPHRRLHNFVQAMTADLEDLVERATQDRIRRDAEEILSGLIHELDLSCGISRYHWLAERTQGGLELILFVMQCDLRQLQFVDVVERAREANNAPIFHPLRHRPAAKPADFSIMRGHSEFDVERDFFAEIGSDRRFHPHFVFHV